MNTTNTKQAAITATVENGGLALTFANGARLTLNPEQLTPEIRNAAMLHGLKQKLVDAAAISRDPSNGRAATIDTKYEAVKEVFDRLMSGAWNKTREGGAGTGGLLFKALCRMYSTKTTEQIKTFLEGKTDAEKAALRKNPKVAAIIEEIKAELGAEPGVTGDDLLAELDDEAGE